MKKGKLAAIAAAALLVLAGGWLLIHMLLENRAIRTAEAEQAAAYSRYETILGHLDAAALTVTEHGETVGVYDLEQLGLKEQALVQAQRCFGEQDRMLPAEFAAQEKEVKLAWQEQAVRQTAAVTLTGEAVDAAAVLQDLDRVARTPAVDAGVRYDAGVYVTVPEVPGNELDTSRVTELLRLTLEGQILNETAPRTWTLELADGDVYLPPAVTAADPVDYAACLERDTADLVITVQILDQVETLAAAPLLQVDTEGRVSVDRKALEQTAADWANVYNAVCVPYVLDSFVEGPIRLSYLAVDYELDQISLVNLLETALLGMEPTKVEAPFFCSRWGEPFSLDGTYVEVDIENQHMAYYVDGDLVVHTDVVTGNPHGNWTPPGFYRVQNRHEDQWLSGADYHVFVEYWVGFHGPYGIHDALWRDEFGGERYETNGSHGCVNTPSEPMKIIHETITVGTPVLVHYVP